MESRKFEAFHANAETMAPDITCKDPNQSHTYGLNLRMVMGFQSIGLGVTEACAIMGFLDVTNSSL